MVRLLVFCIWTKAMTVMASLILEPYINYFPPYNNYAQTSILITPVLGSR